MKRLTKFLHKISNLAALEKHAIISILFCFVMFELNKLTEYKKNWYANYMYLLICIFTAHLLIVIVLSIKKRKKKKLSESDEG